MQTTTRLVNETMEQCIKNCLDCHCVCTATVTYCLSKSGAHSDPVHIRLFQDCAQLCIPCADFMLRDSEFYKQLCGLCAQICEHCAVTCERMSDDEQMRLCAEACRRSAESCKKMAA